MLRTPAVFVTAIICGTLLGGGVLFVIYQLLEHGKDANQITSFINTLVSVVIYAKLRSVDGRVVKVEAQTDGTQSRLLDHALTKSDPSA